jgi:hypothetical protein
LTENKIKLFKFYKQNCAPCYTISRILVQVEIPENIEIIPINVGLEENKKFAKDNEINIVPALMFENGTKIIGLKNKQEVIDFLNGYNI